MLGILPLEALCDTSIETVVMDMQDSCAPSGRDSSCQMQKQQR